MDRIGPYRIQRRLGGGGFGEVWLGVQEPIGREVAVKVFRPKADNLKSFGTSTDAEAEEVLKARFLNEAKILASLEDAPHVISVLDYGETEDGDPWYSMPYLASSLGDRLGRDVFEARSQADLAPSERPRALPLDEALPILSQVLDGLTAAHEQGLVHRDVKPANVLLTDKGQARIADFGIAKAPDSIQSTASSVNVGSRNYMAPEQRVSAKYVDARADVYSLGVLAYRLVTGALPEGRYPDPAVLQPELPAGVNSVILTALSHTPDQRYADAGAMREAFANGLRTAPGGEQTGTGTATGNDGAAPTVGRELQPLYDAIRDELLEWGELDADARVALRPLADFAGLDDEGLDAFIALVTEKEGSAVDVMARFAQAVDKWVAQGASASGRQGLMKLGQSLQLADDRVNAIIDRRRARSEPGPEEPGEAPDGEPAASAEAEALWAQIARLSSVTQGVGMDAGTRSRLLRKVQQLGFDHDWFEAAVRRGATDEAFALSRRVTDEAALRRDLAVLLFEWTDADVDGPARLRARARALGFEGAAFEDLSTDVSGRLFELGRAIESALGSGASTALAIESVASFAEALGLLPVQLELLAERKQANRTTDSERTRKPRADGPDAGDTGDTTKDSPESERKSGAGGNAGSRAGAQRARSGGRSASFTKPRHSLSTFLPRGALERTVLAALVLVLVVVVPMIWWLQADRVAADFEARQAQRQSTRPSAEAADPPSSAVSRPLPVPERIARASSEPDVSAPIREPGTRFRDRLASGGEGPELVVIPSGSFRMGCVSGVGCDDDEKPVHTVRIAAPLAMGVHEVTFEEYERFAGVTGAEVPNDRGWGRGRRPVINVSWEDAQAYVSWLSRETGKRYRLPSEAEWEYAARGRTETPYWTGDCVSTAQANYNGNRDFNDCGADTGLYREQTVPVGSFGANPYGLHDVIGNVYEWTEDCWHESYAGAPDDGSAWTDGGRADCGPRMLRGGSWFFSSSFARSADRGWSVPVARNVRIGFRVVQDLSL